MESWKTAVSYSDENQIWIRGQAMTNLMAEASFTEVVFLLHQGRLPSANERRLMDAILVAVCDHGPGSPSAATSRLVSETQRKIARISTTTPMMLSTMLIVVPITKDDCVRYESLPFPDPQHRDPFDRMIITHALREGLAIVGVDTSFDSYGVTRLW